jgi:hypothetical protein
MASYPPDSGGLLCSLLKGTAAIYFVTGNELVEGAPQRRQGTPALPRLTAPIEPVA